MSPSKVIDWTTFYNIIDGKQRSAKTSHYGVDPITGEQSYPVPAATQQDVDEAVESGKKAFKQWRDVPIEKRREYLGKFRDLCDSYTTELTDLLCKETGKPRAMAQREFSSIKLWSDHHIGLDVPVETKEYEDRTVTTRYSPLGVCAGILPWNFPIMIVVSKLSPAVIAGNTIIFKPSPFTPYTALKLVELAQEVFPPGVVQAVGGDDKLGPMLTDHKDIAKISFTGSIATGKKIMAACAGTLKRVTLELGGNDATIVLPDVDIEKAVPQVALGAFGNSGQICVAIKRIYIHESIYEKFVAALVEYVKKLKVGKSDEEGVMLGPVQNAMQYKKVHEYFADSKDKGYKFAYGSPDGVNADNKTGFFVQPSIIDNPPNDSRIITEEPFGPIVPTQPYSDLDEVIERANNTNTGLGACVFGKDVKKAQEVGWRLEAGSVFINSFERLHAQSFFGGHKESGIGGEWGTQGILSWCNAHVMHVFKS